MGNGDGTGQTPIQIIPPPRPMMLRLISYALELAAGIAGLLGYARLAGILALVGLGFALADQFLNGNTAYIHRDMIDAEGRIKGMKTPSQAPVDTQRPGGPTVPG